MWEYSGRVTFRGAFSVQICKVLQRQLTENIDSKGFKDKLLFRRMAGTSTVGSEEGNALLGHVALLSMRPLICPSDRGIIEAI
jgi:hypothetical protein